MMGSHAPRCSKEFEERFVATGTGLEQGSNKVRWVRAPRVTNKVIRARIPLGFFFKDFAERKTTAWKGGERVIERVESPGYRGWDEKNYDHIE